jgi:CheY-like chemotaxis protein
LTALMGGSIRFESRVGHGTTFHIALPLQQTSKLVERELSSVAAAPLAAAFPVLVVEDNVVNQKVAMGILRTLGLGVAVASNGLEAVQMCACNEYAAVLMDCQMPVLDGFEATRRIRAMNRRRVPIIALTAGAADMERRLVFDAGMDDFLSKPIGRFELRAMLGRWLTATKSDAELPDRQLATATATEQ